MEQQNKKTSSSKNTNSSGEEGLTPVRVRHLVDTHKFLTPFFVLFLMWYFQQFYNATMWTYLALHGTYGILWIFKSNIIPDKTFEQRLSIVGVVTSALFLTSYWSSPFFIAKNGLNAPLFIRNLATVLWGTGLVIMYSADMQKTIELKHRRGHLITTGMFSLSRNINYFGELLIYVGFNILCIEKVIVPCVVMSSAIGFWFTRMLEKEKSLSRYPEFEEYKKRTAFFIPYLY